MTTMMLHPQGPARRAERAARREIIDHIAAAMAFKKGRSWDRMTAARQEQMRIQARTAIQALAYLPRSSILSDAEACIAVAASEAVNDGADASTVAGHAEAYLAELLK